MVNGYKSVVGRLNSSLDKVLIYLHTSTFMDLHKETLNVIKNGQVNALLNIYEEYGFKDLDYDKIKKLYYTDPVHLFHKLNKDLTSEDIFLLSLYRLKKAGLMTDINAEDFEDDLFKVLLVVTFVIYEHIRLENHVKKLSKSEWVTEVKTCCNYLINELGISKYYSKYQ